MYKEIKEGGRWKFPFILYRPKEFTGKIPLILQLHGAGERGCGGDQLAKVERYGFCKLMSEDADYPCLYVTPQCRPETFWSAEIPNIYEFIRQLKTEWAVDEDRIYLTGVSMGAYGTWLTAARYPELFAAIVPVCGGGMVWTANLLKMPIWAFHGTEDNTVYPTESLNMIRKVRQFASPGQDVRLTMLDGVAHNAWDFTFDEPLLQWLLSKHKCPSDSSYALSHFKEK